MPDSPLLPKPRHKLFAFSAVGVAMVCLPLLQVLRYQEIDLRQLDAERALLDPVTQAVHAQHSLLAHRQVAFQVLSSQPQLESTRLAVQAGVDQQLLSLNEDLTRGLWIAALTEARNLNRDWQKLTRSIAAKSISASQSNEAHSLRLEQMLQVMDLLSLPIETDPSPRPLGRVSELRPHNPLSVAARSLMNLAMELDRQAPLRAGASEAEALALADSQSRALQRLAAAEHLLSRHTPGALASEMDGIERSLLVYFELLRPALAAGQAQGQAGVAGPAQLHAALTKALGAQKAFFDKALGLHSQWLQVQQTQLQRQRQLLLAVMAGLAVLALALLRKGLSGPPPSPATGQPSTAASHNFNAEAAPQVSATRLEARKLMDRLRQPRQPAPASVNSKRKDLKPADTQAPQD